MKSNKFTNKKPCLISDELTGKYFIKHSLCEGYLILADKKTLLVDARSYLGVKDKLANLDVEVRLLNSFNDIKNFLIELNAQTVFVDFSRVTVKEFNKIKDFGFVVEDSEQILLDLRSVKSQEEIECTIKACEIAEKAFYNAIDTIKKGITEIQLKEEIEKKVIAFAGEGTSFDTIVAFGKNGAVPHHQTGMDRLDDNMPILIDMGAKYKGYCSDITRTIYFGCPTEKFIKCYDAVLKANVMAEKNIKCGTKTDTADNFARETLTRFGLDKYFTHSLGHGVGLEIHEYPTLSSRKQDELKENMIFTIEPGVYLENEFGIRIEDTVLLTKDGVKRLFTDSKELIIKK